VKSYFFIVHFLFVLLLAACASSTPKITDAQGHYEDESIRVGALAMWDQEKDAYIIEANIYNKTTHIIQLLSDCSDIIGYDGKSTEEGCNEFYSMGLDSGEKYTDKIAVPKKLFGVENGKFRIRLKYELDNGKGKTNVEIPLIVN
jgi:hypothetical protein